MVEYSVACVDLFNLSYMSLYFLIKSSLNKKLKPVDFYKLMLSSCVYVLFIYYSISNFNLSLLDCSHAAKSYLHLSVYVLRRSGKVPISVDI